LWQSDLEGRSDATREVGSRRDLHSESSTGEMDRLHDRGSGVDQGPIHIEDDRIVTTGHDASKAGAIEYAGAAREMKSRTEASFAPTTSTPHGRPSDVRPAGIEAAVRGQQLMGAA